MERTGFERVAPGAARMGSAATKVAAVVVAAVFAGLACSNQRTPVPGRPCTFDGDCASGLICTAGECEEVPPGAGGDSGGPPPLMEQESNDDHNTPTMLPIGATMQANNDSPDDIDYFEVEAPAGDPSGGYFQASLTPVGDGALRFSLHTASDSSPFFQPPGGSVGQPLFFFWAGSPGQRYLIRTARAAGDSAPSFPYKLTVAYQPIADPGESNDGSATASPITVGTQVTAYFFHGFIGTTIVPDEDWYAVHLDPGLATFDVGSVPNDIRMELSVSGPSLNERDIPGTSEGDPIGVSITIPKPDTYLVRARVLKHANFAGYGKGTVLPPSFTTAYTLTVSQ